VWPNAPFGATVKRDRVYPVYDLKLIRVNLHLLDQGLYQLPTRRPSGFSQARGHLVPELLQLPDGQSQRRPLRGLIPPPLPFGAQRVQAPPGRGDPRLELRLLDPSAFIRVDQPPHASLDLADRLFQLLGVPSYFLALLAFQAAPVFLLQALRLPEQLADVLPDGLVGLLRADLPVAAHPLAAESVGLRAQAAVVAVAPPRRGADADPLAGVGVAALLAHQKPLQEVSRAGSSSTVAPAVLGQALLDGREELFTDQGRHRDGDPLLRRRRSADLRVPRILRRSPGRAQGRCSFLDLGLSECRQPPVRRVLQHPTDRCRVPSSLPRACRKPSSIQALTNSPQRDAFLADPREDLSNDPRLFQNDLVSRRPAALLSRDVLVPVGRLAQDAHRALTRRMQAASTTPLEDLRPLVLGDHALNLQQHVVLGTVVQGVVQEDHLNAGLLELLHQEELIRVVTGQPIGTMHIDPIDPPGGRHVPQAFQGRTDQRRPGVSVVQEVELRVQMEAVGSQTLLQGLYLAGDGAGFGLVVRRDASIQGGLKIVRSWQHGYAPWASGSARVPDSRAEGRWAGRRGAAWRNRVGRRSSYAAARRCSARREGEKLRATSRGLLPVGWASAISSIPSLVGREAASWRASSRPVRASRSARPAGPKMLSGNRSHNSYRRFSHIVCNVRIWPAA